MTARRTIDRANSEELAEREAQRRQQAQDERDAVQAAEQATAKLATDALDRLRSEELVAIKSALLPLLKSRRENSKTQRATDEQICKALAEIAARVEDRFRAPVSMDLIAALFAEAAGTLDRLACRSWLASPEFGRRQFATTLRRITHDGDERRSGPSLLRGEEAVAGVSELELCVEGFTSSPRCYPDALRGNIYISSLTVPVFGKAIDVYQRSAEGLEADQRNHAEGVRRNAPEREGRPLVKLHFEAARERRTRRAVGR